VHEGTRIDIVARVAARCQSGRALTASTTPLEDALQLVHLYAERGSPKYERAALRWLERYLDEGEASLVQFARVAGALAKRMD